MSPELKQYLLEGTNLYKYINDVVLVQVKNRTCEIKVRNQDIWVCFLFYGDPHELKDFVTELVSENLFVF